MVRRLVTTDLHLTSNPRDHYRFDFLQWLAEYTEGGWVDEIVICGDLTDAKDRHNAELTNRIAAAIWELSQNAPVVILKGNHDYTNPDTPFFKFLGWFPSVRFIVEPTLSDGALFIPHSFKPWNETWGTRVRAKAAKAGVVFCHQGFEGAKAANGYELAGAKISELESVYKIKCPIYSGDIHTPQQLGPVTYIGTPYPVAFGDDWQGACLELRGGQVVGDHVWPLAPKKTRAVLDADDALGSEWVNALDLGPLDQAKVTVRVPAARMDEWPDMQKAVQNACQKAGCLLCGLAVERIDKQRTAHRAPTRMSPHKTLGRFAESRKLDEPTVEAGLALL